MAYTVQTSDENQSEKNSISLWDSLCVGGIYGKMGKFIPSTKPHIYIKLRDRYIYICNLEHPI